MLAGRNALEAALLDAFGADEDSLDMAVHENPCRLEVGHEAARVFPGDMTTHPPFFLRFSLAGIGAPHHGAFPT